MEREQLPFFLHAGEKLVKGRSAVVDGLFFMDKRSCFMYLTNQRMAFAEVREGTPGLLFFEVPLELVEGVLTTSSWQEGYTLQLSVRNPEAAGLHSRIQKYVFSFPHTPGVEKETGHWAAAVAALKAELGGIGGCDAECGEEALARKVRKRHPAEKGR